LRGLGDQLFSIKGNTDRYVIDRQDEVTGWADALGEDRLAWLRALPAQLAVPEQDALLVHATPRGDEEMLMPETPASEVAAMLAGVEQHTLLCGHVHIQYRRAVAGHDVINPGSVGMPLDGDPRAAWSATARSSYAAPPTTSKRLPTESSARTARSPTWWHGDCAPPVATDARPRSAVVVDADQRDHH
jgi:diadenosine tetraphosphatase ApaH/serine/threonine PP2A family protein phosphatase